jgi:uncharacterized membrane protein
MTRFLRKCLWVLPLTILSFTASAAVITIDQLTTLDQVFDFSDDGISVVGSQMTDASFVGTRTTTVFFGPSSQPGGGFAYGAVGFQNGTFATTEGAFGWMSLAYQIGGAGLDLRPVAGGFFQILARTDSTQANRAMLTMTVNGVSVSQMLTGTDFTPITFAFSSFAGVNFASITTIVMRIEATQAGADVSIRDFTANSIPEPATYILTGAALAGLAVSRRRKK